MNIDVELRHIKGDIAINGDVVTSQDLVTVSELGRPGLLSCGLTELDALGGFRESRAFLMQLLPEDITLRIASEIG